MNGRVVNYPGRTRKGRNVWVFNCDTCGKEKSVRFYKSLDRLSKYCSVQCSSDGNRAHAVGGEEAIARHRVVYKMHMGGHTFQEIAAHLGVSKQRAHAMYLKYENIYKGIDKQ